MKHIKKGVFIILFIIAGLSSIAQVNNKNIIGKYCREVKHRCFPSRYIDILADSTFFYWIGEPEGVITTGTWYLSGNKLILNSHRQPVFNNNDFKLIEMQATSDSQTTIHLKNEYNEPIPSAVCIVTRNGETIESLSDYNGNVTYNFAPLEKIEISFPGLKTVYFKNENLSHNNYVFILKEQHNYYQYFTNEVLIVKGKRLYCEKTKKVRRKYSLYKIKNYYKKMNE
ncbi:MAG: hypothetical protein FD170_2600 [Bacteroidetes bacterium]|nr:MAG: hypothetical protein FD170_2600 [Bacteroidota bacterium]